MAAAAAVKLSGSITGGVGGDKSFAFTATSADASETTLEIVLANGANTITVPTLPLTKGCVIKLPATNIQLVTLKGIAGDTGIVIGTDKAHLLQWDTAPASFVLNSAAAQTGLVTKIIFF